MLKIPGDCILNKIVVLAACLLATGCVEYQTAKPADVRFTSAAQPGLKGYHPMTVRAFLGRVSQGTEIKGVPCDVIGSGYKAKIVTPAAINVPVYGLRSKAVYVECAYDGETLDKSLAPINITENKAMANSGGGGLIGVIVTSAVVAARKNKEHDEYGYNNVVMTFKKGQSAK